MGAVRTVSCPECEREGVSSTVREHTGVSMAPIKTFRDDDGRVHVHEPAPITTSYQCSRGHRFTLTETPRCPTCGWRAP